MSSKHWPKFYACDALICAIVQSIAFKCWIDTVSVYILKTMSLKLVQLSYWQIYPQTALLATSPCAPWCISKYKNKCLQCDDADICIIHIYWQPSVISSHTACAYLSMLGVKFIRVGKTGSWFKSGPCLNITMPSYRYTTWCIRNSRGRAKWEQYHVYPHRAYYNQVWETACVSITTTSHGRHGISNHLQFPVCSAVCSGIHQRKHQSPFKENSLFTGGFLSQRCNNADAFPCQDITNMQF